MSRHGARARKRPALAAVLLAAPLLLLAGCQTKPAMAPILTVEKEGCTAAPETARAAALPLLQAENREDLTKQETYDPLTLTIDRSSPCLDLGEAGRSLYGVAELPRLDQDYIVRVAAEPSGAGIFSPHLVLLDESGRRIREIPQASFLFRGAKLTVQFWAHPAERYLVIASNPQSVGTTIQRLSSHADSFVVAAPPASFLITTGEDRYRSLTYSHGGIVTLLANPPPAVE